MTKEQALEQLKINTGKEPLTISGSATRMADYFKALSIASEALEREIKQPTVNNWISVKDRLPELNHFVFVTKRSEGDIFYGKLIVDMAFYSKKDFKDEFYWRDWNLNEMKNEILAWMPMNFPEPYMEGKIDG